MWDKTCSILCVLEGLISIVCFIWHEPFLCYLVDLVDYMLSGRHSVSSFHQLPNWKSWCFYSFGKVQSGLKHLVYKNSHSSEGGRISLCFNEIRDVVDVNQRQVHIAVWFPKTRACDSCIIPRENKLIDSDKMRKFSYVKFDMFHLYFFHLSCFCCLE